MIGLCCQYIKLHNNKPVNLTKEKHLQLGRFKLGNYSFKHIQNTWINNIQGLFNVVKTINSQNIKVMRFSSNLLPLFEFVEDKSFIIRYLEELGSFVLENKIRVSMHPDQFVVLSSNSNSVINNSVNILLYHNWILDNMGLPSNTYYPINIHGGTKGNSNVLIDTINSLPINVKNRLTLENDEFCYSTLDLYEVYQKTNVPIVFDSHHYEFNNSKSLEEELNIAISTWEQKPMTHLSNSIVNSVTVKERRKHSDYVMYIPEEQLKLQDQIDIDFEFKMKNLAIEKALLDFPQLKR
jgi:UV DNA damage endonuclease